MSVNRLNSAWISNTSAQFASFILFLIASPFLLQRLGEKSFGALTILYLLPQLAVQLELGVISTIVRAYATFHFKDDFTKSSKLVWEAVIAIGLIGLSQSLIFYIFSDFFLRLLQVDLIVKEYYFSVVSAVCVWLPLSLLFSTFIAILRATENFRQIALLTILATSGFWGAAIILTLYTTQIDHLLWMGCMIYFVCIFISLTYLWKQIRITDFRFREIFSFELLLENKSFSRNTFISQLSSLFTYHTDKFLIAIFLSPAAVGVYNIITVTASKLLVLISAVATFTYPRAVRLISMDKLDELADIYTRTTQIIIQLSLSITVSAIVFSESFLRIWIGEELSSTYSIVFKIMMFSYFLATFSVVSSNVSIGMGNAKLPAMFAVIGGVGTLLPCIYLLPKLGIEGAALSCLIGMSQAVIFNFIVAKSLGPNYLRVVIRLTLKSLMILCVFIPLFNGVDIHIKGWDDLILLSVALSLLVYITWHVFTLISKTVTGIKGKNKCMKKN